MSDVNINSVDTALKVMAQVLIRCTIMGVVVLLVWWGVLGLFGDFVYSMHSMIAPISRQQFDLIHYVGILMTKTAVALLFFFPYVAIRLVINKRKSGLLNP